MCLLAFDIKLRRLLRTERRASRIRQMPYASPHLNTYKKSGCMHAAMQKTVPVQPGFPGKSGSRLSRDVMAQNIRLVMAAGPGRLHHPTAPIGGQAILPPRLASKRP